MTTTIIAQGRCPECNGTGIKEVVGANPSPINTRAASVMHRQVCGKCQGSGVKYVATPGAVPPLDGRNVAIKSFDEGKGESRSRLVELKVGDEFNLNGTDYEVVEPTKDTAHCPGTVAISLLIPEICTRCLGVGRVDDGVCPFCEGTGKLEDEDWQDGHEMKVGDKFKLTNGNEYEIKSVSESGGVACDRVELADSLCYEITRRDLERIKALLLSKANHIDDESQTELSNIIARVEDRYKETMVLGAGQ